VKFYDFIEKQPKIEGLVIVEGTDSILAQRALDTVIERTLEPELRSLNLDLIAGPETEHVGRAVADAVRAMPFLAERRVVVVRNCHQLRAQPRRDVWAVAEDVPVGNTLVLEDLFAPNKKTKPEPYGALAGRKALRIDTTVNAEVRERFGSTSRRRSAHSPNSRRAKPILARSPAISRNSRSVAKRSPTRRSKRRVW
jgi:hypothetical protein